MAVLNTANNQWKLGYVSFGGVTTWANNFTPGVASASPIKVASSKPNWMLVADVMMKFGGVWGDSSQPPSRDSNLPAHKAKGGLPAGGNEVFIDGSAPWVKAKDRRFIHQFSGARQRGFYFYQEDLGGLEPHRSALGKIQ